MELRGHKIAPGGVIWVPPRPEDRRGRRPVYPWVEWIQTCTRTGEWLYLEKGEDFHLPRDQFARSVASPKRVYAVGGMVSTKNLPSYLIRLYFYIPGDIKSDPNSTF